MLNSSEGEGGGTGEVEGKGEGWQDGNSHHHFVGQSYVFVILLTSE